ncbi:TPA: YggL family protein [Pasteurella multocida]
MAIKRNRRQRKKMHLAEFQELGFLVNWQFAEGTAIEKVDEVVDRFICEVIQPNGLAYEGSGYLHWEGLVCLEALGKCNESHRTLVKEWLEQSGLQQIEISPLFDIWWEYPAKDA